MILLVAGTIIKLTCVAATPNLFPVPIASVSPFSPNTIGYAGSNKTVSPEFISTSKIFVVGPVVTPVRSQMHHDHYAVFDYQFQMHGK